MNILPNDRIGNFIVLIIIAPVIFYKGLNYNDLLLGIIGLLLLVYNGYLICSFYLKKIKKDIVVNNDIIQNITLEISDK